MRLGPINQRAVADLARAREVARQVRDGAIEIRDEARRLAPFRTGALRASLTVRKANNVIEYRIGWDASIADYGPAVEFGTEDTAAQPHLRPAAIKWRGR